MRFWRAVRAVVWKDLVTEARTRESVLSMIFFGLTILLSTTLGRTTAMVWVLGLPTMGGVVHTLWCRKHGIHPITAEPREKFYKLMGWDIR